MAIMRYRDFDPFREIANLIDLRPALLREFTLPETRFPVLDMEEKGNQLIVKAEIPGMKAEDVNVQLVDGQLVISGERKEEREEKDEENKYYYKERTFGSFSRTIPLGQEVDREKVNAEYKNGILTVTLEKTESKRTKQIKVKS